MDESLKMLGDPCKAGSYSPPASENRFKSNPVRAMAGDLPIPYRLESEAWTLIVFPLSALPVLYLAALFTVLVVPALIRRNARFGRRDKDRSPWYQKGRLRPLRVVSFGIGLALLVGIFALGYALVLGAKLTLTVIAVAVALCVT